jgi:peptide/nickel transport system substrate-binding protein
MMLGLRVRTAAVAVVSLMAAACDSNTPLAPTPTPTPDNTPRGGTLRIAIPHLRAPTGGSVPSLPPGAVIDPHLNGSPEGNELWRCCLVRTLMSHRGLPTNEGGAELFPDLAAADPDVSADGLTWTFHVRTGLHYGPPLQSTEITAPDIVRGIQRSAHLLGVSGSGDLLNVVVGFEAYANGKADTIAGLETPDPHTLVVHLTGATGDFGERMALPQFAIPIPPSPRDPRAPFGVATGHDDGDSGFLVSSGPYMVEGIDRVDFSQPPDRQQPASGYLADKSITLVRNPSWNQASDSLRPAYVDRIEITAEGVVGTLEEAAAGVDKGVFDLVFVSDRPPQAPPEQIARYQASGGPGRVDLHARDSVRSMTMNLAVPPFDDVHVRRAANFVIDKAKVLDGFGGTNNGSIVGHVALDSLEQGALVNYDPYHSSGNHGDLAAAKREMAMSRYDPQHEGICHADVCQHVAALSFGGKSGATIAETIHDSLQQIGVSLDITNLPRDLFFSRYFDPTQHVAVGLIPAWQKDYLNASNFFEAQFSHSAVGPNHTLVGATPDQLRLWGYAVTTVPGIDDRIAECFRLVGATQIRCWTALDQYVTERVVPMVPLISENSITVIPKRVLAFSYDQAWDLPALDRVAIAH